MLWIIVALGTLLAVLSLRGEAARARFFRESLAASPPEPLPAVSVIVPVKGEEDGLAANLASLAGLDYPDYELIVVAHSEQDMPRTCVPARARTVIAGDGDPETGEKINNLLAALGSVRESSAVFAFADSDGRVPAGWLKALVTALHSPGTGASTGYRWHLPSRATLWPILRSVWNAVIAGGMGAGNNRFCWGGATAIRRETFYGVDVPKWWRGAVSDDYRLSEAVRAAGFRIAFAPGALVASMDSTTAGEFLGWSRRQMMITRFYAPLLWRIAFFAHVVYCGAMVGAVVLFARGSVLALGLLLLQVGIGWYKAAGRVRLARLAMPEHAGWFDRHGWVHVLLTPVGTWLWLYGCAASAFSDTINWRGYRLRLRRLT